jgi:hypothetical protein
MATAVVAGAALVNQVEQGRRARGDAADASALSEQQSASAMASREEAIRRLEAVGIPTIEAQKIVLESPELVGLQEIRDLGPSAMEGITADPRLKDAQMGALESMQQFTEAGLTDAEKAQQMMMQRSVAGEAQARDKSILQSMAERGVGGSGMELAQRLSSSQAGAERRAMAQAQLSGQAQQRALQAITQGAGMAGSIRGQEFGEQAQTAQSADAIARFNAAQRAQIEGANLSSQQQIEQQRAAASQQQEIHNQALIQQDLQNRMAKEKSIASAITGTAQAQDTAAARTLEAGQAAAAGRIQQGAAMTGAAGTLIGAFGGGSSKATKQPEAYKPPAPTDYSKIGEFNAEDGGVAGYEDGGTVEGYEHGGAVDGYAGGGVPVPDEDRYLEGDVVPGDDFEGDRVDAKVNSGEMVLNIEQQQRLMELLKGYRDLSGLGDEDIVEPAMLPDLDAEGYGGPGERAPEEVRVGIADQAQSMENLTFADGGVPNKKEPLARGLVDEHKKMSEQGEQMKQAQKDTNARIKALEVLMGTGEKK